jgi:hypothetical protein
MEKQPDKVPAKTELMPSKGGSWLLSDALKSKMIYTCSIEEIKEQLRYAMLLTGIRYKNMPVDEEKDVLIEWIVKQYGTHRIDEIRVAFSVAFSGELGIDACVYENFSCEYFGRIFQAYREWAIKVVTTFRPYQPSELEALTAGGTPIDWTDSWQRMIAEDWSESAFFDFIPWCAIYDWLKRTNQITGSWDIMERCREEEVARIDRKHFPTPEERVNRERFKCIHWKHDQVAIQLLLTKAKTIAVKQLLIQLKSAQNEG